VTAPGVGERPPVVFGAALLGATQHRSPATKRQLNVGINSVFHDSSNQRLNGGRGATNRVKAMNHDDFNSMSVDQLWALRLKIDFILLRRIAAEKAKLEKRLRQLQSNDVTSRRERRPYPQVLPKYRNPANPAETWAGRGRQPRWVTEQLSSGKKLDDFRIQPASGSARRSGGGRKAQRTQGRS
jgi:DNA-binding protein H-NS